MWDFLSKEKDSWWEQEEEKSNLPLILGIFVIVLQIVGIVFLVLNLRKKKQLEAEWEWDWDEDDDDFMYVADEDFWDEEDDDELYRLKSKIKQAENRLAHLKAHLPEDKKESMIMPLDEKVVYEFDKTNEEE